MSGLNVGDKFPSGIKFEYAPITDTDLAACSKPQEYDASSEFAGKKAVLVSVPGAFTPGCHGVHVPQFIEAIDKIRGKGVDVVVVISYNDAFVMNGWGKVSGAKPDGKILFMSDSKSKLSQQIGWTGGKMAPERNARYAVIVEKDGTISYAGKEESIGDVKVSSADAVLAKL